MAKGKAQDVFAEIVKAGATAAKPAPAARAGDVITSNWDDAATSKPDGPKTRPHVSLYVTPAVQEAVKRMALDHGYKRPHDVYVEALRRFMNSMGADFDRLQSG